MIVRWVSKFLLALIAILSIAIVVGSILLPAIGIRRPLDDAAVVAGALAVLTAVISGWSATKVVELQEDQLRPYPYPFIDARSRTGLLQLAVTNFGGGSAHDVQLAWDEPLRNSEGKEVSFPGGTIPVLLPKETLKILVDGQIQFYGKYQNANYTGRVLFNDSSGRHFRHPFLVDADKFRRTLRHEDDLSQAYEEIGEIRKALNTVAEELKKVREALETP